jgi:cell division protease FtsH
MDGFEGNLGIIVLAATNRPDVLDPALLRPGRFDRQVVLDAPDQKGRKEILTVHGKDKVLADTIDLDLIAKRTPGFTGADLANVMNEAALLAARKDRDRVEMEDLEEAIDRVMTGPERRSRVIRPNEKRVIAYHECGHALVAAYLPAADPVHKVSIIPRGHAALGYTMQLPETDRYLVRKQELLDKICVSLGGRTAEELIFDHMSTGAANDLEHVTSIARSMVCRFGMSETLGPIAFERSSRAFLQGMENTLTGNYSEETLAAIDAEVVRLVADCQQRTRDLLKTNRGLLEKMAEKLLEVEIMDADEFRDAITRYCGELGLEPPPERSETGALETDAEA